MKLRDLDLSDNRVNAEHRALGLPPVEAAVTGLARAEPGLRLTMWSVALLMAGLTIYLAARLLDQPDDRPALQLVVAALESREFWTAVAGGLLAQTVDGALGMAYGITSTSFLLATAGLTPPANRKLVEVMP